MADRPARPPSSSRITGERALRSVLRVLLGLVALSYFTVGVGMAVLNWAIIPHIDRFRPQIERLAGHALHAHVHIDRLAARWHALAPQIEVSGLRIEDAEGRPGLSVPHMRGVLAWRSLWRLAPLFNEIEVQQPRIVVRREADGSVLAAGVPVASSGRPSGAFGDWLLKQRAVTVREAGLVWHDARNPHVQPLAVPFQLALRNRGHLHRLGAQLGRGRLAQGLDVRARFRHGLFSRPVDWHSWVGQAYVNGKAFDLVEVQRYLKLPVRADAGHIDAQIWLDFTAGRVQRAEGSLRGGDLRLEAGGTADGLQAPAVATRFRAYQDDDFYSLALSDLTLRLADQAPLPDGTPLERELRVQRMLAEYRASSAGRGERMHLSGDFADVGLLADFMRGLPLPRRVSRNLDRLRPHGLIRDFDARWQRHAPSTPAEASVVRATGDAVLERYRLKGEMINFGLAGRPAAPGLSAAGHPHVGVPGFENFSGRIDADEHGGRLDIDSHDLAVDVDGLFEPSRLRLDTLRGHAQWRAQGSGMQTTLDLRLPELAFGNADAAGSLALRWRGEVGRPRDSVLDLDARFSRLDVPSVPRYLPTSIGAALRSYLAHALVAGTSRAATISVHGPLNTFPYERQPGTGRFRIVAPFVDGSFDPSPYPPIPLPDGEVQRWPVFHEVRGQLVLDNDRLEIAVPHARYRSLSLQQVKGTIASLADHAQAFVIDGQISGPLDDMLRYVDESPLGVWSAHGTQGWRGGGNAALALQLRIPRTPASQHAAGAGHRIKVHGAIDFANDRLAAGTLPPLSRLSGRVEFTDDSAHLVSARAHWLGGEVRASGAVTPEQGTDITVSGRIDADQWRTLPETPALATLARRVRGSAPYTVSVKGAPQAAPAMALRADLSSLAIDLPAPLGKPAGQALPLRLTYQPGVAPAAQTDETDAAAARRQSLSYARIDATLGEWRAALLRRGGLEPRIVSGTLAYGLPASLPRRGLSLLGRFERLDGDAWRAVLDEAARSAAGSAADAHSSGATTQWPTPDRVDLSVGQLLIFSRRFDQVHLSGRHEEQAWRGRLDSEQIAGQLAWNEDRQIFSAQLSTLHIPDAEPSTAKASASGTPSQASAATGSPERHPAVDLKADDVVLGRRRLGRMLLQAHHVTEGGVPVWQLDRMRLDNPAATLEARGQWRTDAPSTHAEAHLDIRDAGALLERLGLPAELNKGHGTLAGNLDWHGTPGAIDYGSLRGALALTLHDGQLPKLDNGAARLLGVLSLQGLARLVTLDFRSLIGEGLPFDTLTGTSTVRDGVARTDDTRLESPAVRVRMRGSVDLGAQRQQLLFTAIPHANAASASLAAALVNPVLGLGTLAAQLVFAPALSRTLTHCYAVDGTWHAPHAERVSCDRGSIAETPAQR